jgi:capsule polysaccharide export protein KpsE/RkpR
MSQIDAQDSQQRQQMSEFNKIKDQYKAKLDSYRDCYETIDLGKDFENKTHILSQIEREINSFESQLTQLQVFFVINIKLFII